MICASARSRPYRGRVILRQFPAAAAAAAIPENRRGTRAVREVMGVVMSVGDWASGTPSPPHDLRVVRVGIIAMAPGQSRPGARELWPGLLRSPRAHLPADGRRAGSGPGSGRRDVETVTQPDAEADGPLLCGRTPRPAAERRAPGPAVAAVVRPYWRAPLSTGPSPIHLLPLASSASKRPSPLRGFPASPLSPVRPGPGRYVLIPRPVPRTAREDRSWPDGGRNSGPQDQPSATHGRTSPHRAASRTGPDRTIAPRQEIRPPREDDRPPVPGKPVRRKSDVRPGPAEESFCVAQAPARHAAESDLGLGAPAVPSAPGLSVRPPALHAPSFAQLMERQLIRGRVPGARGAP